MEKRPVTEGKEDEPPTKKPALGSANEEKPKDPAPATSPFSFSFLSSSSSSASSSSSSSASPFASFSFPSTTAGAGGASSSSSSTFSWGSFGASSSASSSSSSASFSIPFGGSALFGSPTSTGSNFTTPPSASPFQFPSAVGNGFSRLAQEAASKSKDGSTATADAEGEGAADVSNIEAAPPNAVPLFAPVAVETGEEDEQTTFSARAKVLQLEKTAPASGGAEPASGAAGTLQWKEKGVGTLKLNKNTKTGKHRLLLRTEGFRLALNILLDDSCTVKPPDPLTNGLMLSSLQQASESEGQQVVLSYCIRINRKVSNVSYDELFQKLNEAKTATAATKETEN